MALVHQATLSPTKLELVTAYLDSVPWGGTGEVEMIGGYRFDDPAGEVGVEALLVSRDDRSLHIPLTYRGAPLPEADEFLVSTMTHSVLGDRWIYEAAADPVAVDCFVRALRGRQEQARLEIQSSDGSVTIQEPPVRIRVEGAPADATALALSDDLASPVSGAAWLVAEWDGGAGVVAALR
ncbi:CG0192-related protein [Gordonia sihwensis]|uniref:CG0192-related protein n=1 Tax=Gordonia sihwensis TaxID=173559 RepID=UPI003D978C6E